jgi:hypothetical protein
MYRRCGREGRLMRERRLRGGDRLQAKEKPKVEGEGDGWRYVERGRKGGGW